MKDFHRRILRRISRTGLPGAVASAPLTIRGKVFRTPMIAGAMCDLAEPWMVDLLEILLPRKKGSFLDVGVNIGQTLLVVKALDPSRHYVGIEPNPQCVAYAERLIETNAFKGCVILPVGLGERADILMLQLYHGTTTDSSASLVKNFRPDEPVNRTLPVAVFSFADIENALGKLEPGLVKIDIEGGEADVVNSMQAAIGEHRPWIIIEILPCYTPQRKDRIARQRRIEDMARVLGYSILRIMKTNAGRLSHFKLIDEIGIHGDITWSDYVLCPIVDAEYLVALVAGDAAAPS